jgi:raffinose/stachyose/melibiose transport system permease protein
MKKNAKKISAGKITIAVFLLVCLVVFVLPYYFMLITSFKSQPEMFTKGVFALPKSINFDNYIKVFRKNYLRYLFNSITVMGISLFIVLITSAMSAYVFSRLKLRFGNPLLSLVVACMTIPIHVTLIPVYLLTQKIGIYDTLLALVGPYVAFNLPISIFILVGFMQNIPIEMEEVAQIDGCGKKRIFFNIILPLSMPGIVTLAIYNSIKMWNEFIFAMVLTQTPKYRTLPLAIWEFQGEFKADIPLIMTVLTLSTLPMLIGYIIGKERLMEGMVAGAIKG